MLINISILTSKDNKVRASKKINLGKSENFDVIGLEIARFAKAYLELMKANANDGWKSKTALPKSLKYCLRIEQPDGEIPAIMVQLSNFAQFAEEASEQKLANALNRNIHFVAMFGDVNLQN